MPTPNIELLQRIKSFILTHPEHFDMYSGLGDLHIGCGTTACFAGTACLLGLPNPKTILEDGNPWEVWTQAILSTEELKIAKANPSWCMINTVARELLGLTKERADTLFFIQRWTIDHRRQYIEAVNNKKPKEAAAIAAEYIDYFISTLATEAA